MHIKLLSAQSSKMSDGDSAESHCPRIDGNGSPFTSSGSSTVCNRDMSIGNHTRKRLETNIGSNINWTISCDYGGEGPKHDFEAHLEHFVYLALVPLPRLHQPVDTRKTVPDHAIATTASVHR